MSASSACAGLGSLGCRILLSVSLAILLLAGIAAGAAAQAREPGAVGLAVGLGWVPNTRDSYCGRSLDRTVRGVLAEGRLALRLGHGFSAEGRLSAQSKVALYSCAAPTPIADGTYATREYHLRGDGFAGGDLRVRYDVPRRPLALTAGFGEVWGVRAPYVVFGPGLRLGRRLRLILDGDVLYARVPYDGVVTAWRGGAPVEVLVRSPMNEWLLLGGGRLGIELGLR